MNESFLTICKERLGAPVRLKARWVVLTKRLDLKLENVPVIICPCFVLHNYCEQHSTYLNEDIVTSQIEHAKRNEEETGNVPHPVYSCNSSEGEVV